MTTLIPTIDRGTIYWGGTFDYRKKEARQIEVRVGQYAQYDAAVVVTCIEKGRRKQSELTLTSGRLVILSGWGHPSAPGTYDAGTPLAGDSGATIHHTRYPMNDLRWNREFDAFLEDYIIQGGAAIVADFRDHDFQGDDSHFSARNLTRLMPVIVWGVRDGQIVPRDHWEGGIAPMQEFSNLAEAQFVFPELALTQTEGSHFVGPSVYKKYGHHWSRFDTHENWDLVVTKGLP